MNIKRKLKTLAAAFVAGAAMLAPRGAWADTWTDSSENVWTYTISGSVAKITGVSLQSATFTIPDELGGKPVELANTLFKDKSDAVHVTIPDTVKAISQEAFLNCVNLKTVTIIGNNLKSIGARAFKGCKNLESFVMPNSVNTLGQGIFSGCSNMKSVTLRNTRTRRHRRLSAALMTMECSTTARR